MQLRSGKFIPSTHNNSNRLDSIRIDTDISNDSCFEYSFNTNNDIFIITDNYNKVVISRLVPLLNNLNEKIYKINKKQRKILDNDFKGANSLNDFNRYVKKEIKYHSNLFSLLNFYQEIIFYHQNNGVIVLENEEQTADFTLHLSDVEKIIKKIESYVYDVLFDEHLIKKAKKQLKIIKIFNKIFQREFQMELEFNKKKNKNKKNNKNDNDNDFNDYYNDYNLDSNENK